MLMVYGTNDNENTIDVTTVDYKKKFTGINVIFYELSFVYNY